MAFSDYKNIEQVQTEFNISYREERFIEEQAVEPDARFLEEFAFNQAYLPIYSTEGARSEAVIFPILREAYKPYSEQYELWIQRPLSYDQKLSGTPDYLVSGRSPLGKTVLTLPILVVVEAKRNDFDQGWGQCLAELVAAQKLNDQPECAVYGIVTDGKRWEIGKLVRNQFLQNASGYTVEQMPHLFGALHAIFEAAATA
ncbi:hypothetical protein U14_01320 [Candidatus Moduliflexus flocculans]|uniref:Type I restriction enzyme R protein N-terminal domain-containing protein n=1 Tax=Candidatus Moduliflexus flocculans TaxID=1499966 RepID=A0A0S6VYP5_9BACT|nr:hypothetical protein U14_01320 [Candidatus Moduliflexus flocculans]